jgi:hypothetical protein
LVGSPRRENSEGNKPHDAKILQHQLINAGMPEEIRKHMMGHTLKDKVREVYFLTDSTEL